MLVIILSMILIIVIAAVSLANNANGVVNWFYGDVESGTDVAPDCKPKKYLVEFHGTLDLINDFTWTGYELKYVDAHISDIRLDPRGLWITSDDFEGTVCLFDVLKGGDRWVEERVDCVNIEDKVTKGKIEKFPFEFKYNLYDNDCNGEVDDHTFNVVVDLQTENDGYIHEEKTVTIINGKPIFQNVDQWTKY